MPKRDIGGAVSRYSTVLKRANTQSQILIGNVAVEHIVRHAIPVLLFKVDIAVVASDDSKLMLIFICTILVKRTFTGCLLKLR